MKLTELITLENLAKINGIITVGGLMAFYDRMKQDNETLTQTLSRHTREVLGLE